MFVLLLIYTGIFFPFLNYHGIYFTKRTYFSLMLIGHVEKEKCVEFKRIGKFYLDYENRNKVFE